MDTYKYIFVKLSLPGITKDVEGWAEILEMAKIYLETARNTYDSSKLPQNSHLQTSKVFRKRPKLLRNGSSFLTASRELKKSPIETLNSQN